MAHIVVIVPDLMFQPRIVEAARALKHEVALADTPERVSEELAAFEARMHAAEARVPAPTGPPGVVVVDLHADGVDVMDAIRRAHRTGARILAFGRHTDAAALRSAREAGAEVVVARSQLVEQLPALLESLTRSVGDGGG